MFDVGEVDLGSLFGALVRTIEMPVVGVDAASEKRPPAWGQEAANRRAGLKISASHGAASTARPTPPETLSALESPFASGKQNMNKESIVCDGGIGRQSRPSFSFREARIEFKEKIQSDKPLRAPPERRPLNPKSA